MKGKSQLDRLRVAAPCNAEWRWMYGDDRVRFCGQCNLNVYNLSAMTKEEAEDIIRRKEGRLCVRYYLRKDGTILTKNCPVGLRAIKDKLTSTRIHILTAIMSFLAYIGVLSWVEQKRMDFPTAGGAFFPESVRAPLTVEKSEKFIRERAILKIEPIVHSKVKGQMKGDAVVKVLIERDGEVLHATFIEGEPKLKGIAVDAAGRWKFEPVLVDSKPVRVESTLTFHFKQ